MYECMCNYFYIVLFVIGLVGFFFFVDYVFNNVLELYQQICIKVVFGMEEDLVGVGYNVNQSKIVIGLGGLWGKGFLNGIQIKLKYVFEQDIDFIFCMVGEEEGFVGLVVVLFFFIGFILCFIVVVECQYICFVCVYGYLVLSIFLFYLFINIGMVLGLIFVIGILLFFFSYGGFFLWGFMILFFVFLCIDVGWGKCQSLLVFWFV